MLWRAFGKTVGSKTLAFAADVGRSRMGFQSFFGCNRLNLAQLPKRDYRKLEFWGNFFLYSLRAFSMMGYAFAAGRISSTSTSLPSSCL